MIRKYTIFAGDLYHSIEPLHEADILIEDVEASSSGLVRVFFRLTDEFLGVVPLDNRRSHQRFDQCQFGEVRFAGQSVNSGPNMKNRLSAMAQAVVGVGAGPCCKSLVEMGFNPAVKAALYAEALWVQNRVLKPANDHAMSVLKRLKEDAAAGFKEENSWLPERAAVAAAYEQLKVARDAVKAARTALHRLAAADIASHIDKLKQGGELPKTLLDSDEFRNAPLVSGPLDRL